MVQKLLCFIRDRNWSTIIFLLLIIIFWRRFGIKAVVAQTNFSKWIVLENRLNKNLFVIAARKNTCLKYNWQKKNNWFYLIFKETRSEVFETFRWQFWQYLLAPITVLWLNHQIDTWNACTARGFPLPQLSSSASTTLWGLAQKITV